MLNDRIDRLVLVSPVPASGVPLPPEALVAYTALAGTRDGLAHVLSSMMVRALPDAEQVSLIDDSASVSEAAFVEGLTAWTSASFTDQLSALSVPTRVLCGAEEQPLSPGLLRATVLEHIPGSTLQTIDGAGHYPQLEAPEAFCDALAGALQS